MTSLNPSLLETATTFMMTFPSLSFPFDQPRPDSSFFQNEPGSYPRSDQEYDELSHYDLPESDNRDVSETSVSECEEDDGG